MGKYQLKDPDRDGGDVVNMGEMPYFLKTSYNIIMKKTERE
jgi:hypothetical protein